VEQPNTEEIFQTYIQAQKQHKRDIGGRTFYHLTTPDRVEGILRSGLRSRRGGGLSMEPTKRRRGKIFLWTSRGAAEDVAEWYERPGLAILEVQVPGSKRLYKDRETEEERPYYEDIRVVTGSIPAENIKLVGYTK